MEKHALLCRSGSESDDSDEDAERRKKPIPKWARGQALTQALVAQMAVDPDEIFKLHQKTCPLNEVFSNKSESIVLLSVHCCCRMVDFLDLTYNVTRNQGCNR